MARNAIFISYSHADKQWLDRFVKALRIGVLSESYSIWSDEQIGAGREWDPQIEANIASARIALLLVTSEFVHSTYIGTRELPAIFDRNRRKGLDLQWVPSESVPEENLKASCRRQTNARRPSRRSQPS